MGWSSRVGRHGYRGREDQRSTCEGKGVVVPTIIWSKSSAKDKLEPSMKKKAFAFFEKLSEDDTLPGLNIEEITGSQDKRVRTGRVDDNFRAVLFKLKQTDEPVYVIHGIWPHDRANTIAEQVTLGLNPVNGMPEVRLVLDQALRSVAEVASAQSGPSALAIASAPTDGVRPIRDGGPNAAAVAEQEAVPWSLGVDAATLHGELGLDLELAEAAVTVESDDAFQTIVESAAVEWQGLVLLALATGSTVEDVRREFHLDEEVDESGTEDEQLVSALGRDAAKATFQWIEDNEELRRIIEAGDFGAWRVFLHPEQRNYVERDWKGPFRLSGGAGTGKTVVAVHRARRLASAALTSRVLLTTYTRNLADDLEVQLKRLDEKVPVAEHLGEPGILVRGVDAVARAVIQKAGRGIDAAGSTVLGAAPASALKGSKPGLWVEALREGGLDLPKELATESFMASEYAMVVLPARITTLTGYLRVRRAGRGVALDRSRRAAVWGVIEAYRSLARFAGSTDFEEKAAIATEWLRERRAAGDEALFDHVVVDEAQDLTPSRLAFLRALVGQGPNDLFICEDSHQRIYGHKVTLSQCGIKVVGRSRRLTLNYRTTEQNLRWAMSILSGGAYSNLEGESESHSYRSARSGPEPELVAGKGLSEELDQAAELIRSWLPDSGRQAGRAPSPESIAILVRDRYRRDTVVNGLRERGIEVRPVDAENVTPGRPVAMTMHRAKGLEFSHVLLFNLQEKGAVWLADDEDAKDVQLRERSLVYVAATRARDVLAVSWSGGRPILIPS